MSFGDWEMFKVMVISLREHELTSVVQAEESAAKNVRFVVSKNKQERSSDKKRDTSKREEGEKELRRSSSTSSKHSSMENQVCIFNTHFPDSGVAIIR